MKKPGNGASRGISSYFTKKPRCNTRRIEFTFPLLLSILWMPISEAQITFSDSMKLEQIKLQGSDVFLDSLLKMSEKAAEEDLQAALYLARSGCSHTHESGKLGRRADFQYQLGDIHQMMGSYDSAHMYFDLCIAYYENMDLAEERAAAMTRKAFVYQNQSDFVAAQQLMMDVVAIYEQTGDRSGLAEVFVDLADVLYYQNRFEEGLEFGNRAIQLYQRLDDDPGLANAYQYTADNYLGLKDYAQALAYMDKTISLLDEAEVGRLRIGSAINSRANVLKYQKNYEGALEGYRQSYRIAKDLNHPGGISATLGNIADVLMQQQDYAAALPFKKEALEISKKHGFRANMIENLDHLSIIYRELGDYKNALHYREENQAMKDSVLSLEKAAITKELTTKYETEKKEAQNLALTRQVAQQRTVQLITAGFLLLLGFLLFVLYRSFNLKKKSNAELGKLNEALKKKNIENELLLKEIHHRVKNNLQIISSLLSLQSRSIQDQSVRDAIIDSESRVRSMSLIHKKLYKGSDLTAIEMKSYFETLSNNLIDAYAGLDENVDVILEMDQLELDVKYAIPLGLIANELITNSLKYAFHDTDRGAIDIKLVRKDGELVLTVSDNGNLNAPKPHSNDTGGFGSSLVEMLTKQLKGRITRQTEYGYATEIKFPYFETAA